MWGAFGRSPSGSRVSIASSHWVISVSYTIMILCAVLRVSSEGLFFVLECAYLKDVIESICVSSTIQLCYQTSFRDAFGSIVNDLRLNLRTGVG
jgi:hypothetical protein